MHFYMPDTGGAGVALIGEIAGLVFTAIANKANLTSLTNRAEDLIVRTHSCRLFKIRSLARQYRIYVNILCD
jgi:hypothetical protein